MNRRTPMMPRWWYLGPLVLFVAVMVAPIGRSEAAPVPGSQGTDTSLEATESKVTVSGRGPFSSLRVTVSQTEDLTSQAVSVTWTGGTRTRRGPGDFAAHYLQIFQCWGEDDGTNAANPGPPPEQCQQGAVGGQPGGVAGSSYPNGFAMSRLISRTSFPGYTPGIGVVDRRDGGDNVWLPFRAVDGTVVDFQSDPLFNPSVQGGNFWLNPYFNIITTNEIVGGRTGSDGRGSELFEVQTGLEAPGLGCGQRVQVLPGGGKGVPKCWIVVVPRGDPAAENKGMGGFEDLADQFGVFSSPLAPEPWKNRIAIPIEFKPVESACALSSVERRVAGSELVAGAITSWQPVLCGPMKLPPFSYANIPDAAARQQLAASVSGGPGMVLVSQPLSQAQENPASPTVYAPLAVSGIAIGFNVERQVKIDAPEAAQDLAGVRVAELNLTPRIVAKLLTQSYQSQVYVANANPGYRWADDNPYSMGDDPDFLQFNPEFELLTYVNRLFGGLQLPAGSSDVATAVWEWVLSDPEARAWLDGNPDPWGMRVNPAYATKAEVNTNGIAFGATIPSSFPKADPFCYQAPRRGNVVAPPLCGTDWMPYTRTLREGAQFALAGNDPARIVENVFAQAASEVWRRDPPQIGGRRVMLAITDTASARRFGLPMARLSRAGDNGSSRRFISPTDESLTAGVAAMKATPSGVLVPDSSATAPGAYPLTAITWAAIKPLSLDAAVRSDFAAFLSFASGAGQTPGLDPGQLPRGYAPLPSSLRSLATTAAERVTNLQPTPAPTPAPAPAATAETTTTTTTTAPPSEPVVSVASVPEVASAPPAGAASFPVAATPSRPNSSSNSSGSSGARPSSAAPAADETDETVTASSDVPASSEPPPQEDEVPATSVPASAGASPPSTTVPAPALTPGLDVSLSRFVVAIVSALVLLSALFALELTKRARRAEISDDGEGLDDRSGSGAPLKEPPTNGEPVPITVVPGADAPWAPWPDDLKEAVHA